MSSLLGKLFRKMDPADFEDIKQNKTINMERYRLRTLVKIGGNQAHDINSPLLVLNSSAKKLTEVFKKYKEDMPKEELVKLFNEIKPYAEKIDLSSKKVTIIANFLREQTANLFDEKLKEFKIKSLIEKLIYKPKYWDILRKHTSKCAVNVSGEIIITGYEKSLELILGNLIQNAAESYPEKEEKKGNVEDIESQYKIEITAKQVENNVLIAVKDYGCGMSKEVQKDIFYETMKNITFKKGAGGLSLFIAPTIIVGQLGGEIWFQSEEGVGSTFYLSIPVCCGERLNNDYKKILGVGDCATRR